jgi:hypothetical protein
MESVINQVIDIDKKAVLLKQKMMQIVEENKIKLKNQLEEMENQSLEKARSKGKEKYQDYIQEGNEQSKKILLEAEKQCKVLEKAFNEVHEGLEEDLFREIFKI